MPSDPVIDRIRETRKRISEQFDHDPVKLILYYRELEKQYANRIYRESSQDETDDLSSRDNDKEKSIIVS
jgi:hypothetical protein